MGVKAARKKKKLKFRPIIKEFRVSTRSEVAQVCNQYIRTICTLLFTVLVLQQELVRSG